MGIPTGHWLAGVPVELAGKTYMVVTSQSDVQGELISSIKMEVDPLTISQFTGLQDSKGKDVYEGDVVFSGAYNPPRMIVKFIEGGFCMSGVPPYDALTIPIDISHFFTSSGCQFEIVGNLWEGMYLDRVDCCL